jgi:nucleoside-diphosphate-sugar epimerase
MRQGFSVLVTGGAGYLGSMLVPELLAAGHRVTVLDNFMYSQNSLAHLCANPDFDAVHGDARAPNTLSPLLSKADMVIPLAALVGAPLCQKDPIAATTTNRDAVATLCKMLSPSQRVLMPTTNSGYGVGEPGKFCTEDTPLRPVSLYGRDKVAAEQIMLGRENAISLRLATVFGMSPRMRVDLLVNDFVHRAVTDRFIVLFEARFKRNYLHIRDVARAFLHAIDNFDRMRAKPTMSGFRTPISPKPSCANASRRGCRTSYISKRRSVRTQTSAITSSPTPASKRPDTARNIRSTMASAN